MNLNEKEMMKHRITNLVKQKEELPKASQHFKATILTDKKFGKQVIQRYNFLTF